MNLKKWIPALLVAAAATQAISPVEKYGPLAVKGNKLVDSTGTSVILRGMSLFWHYHLGGGEFWTRGALQTVMTDWHASVIRAPIGVEDASSGGYKQLGFVSDSTNGFDFIRRAINHSIDLGLYVIVDWHTHNARTTEAKTFFGTLAKEYGNTPNIIWEIYNEPTSGDAMQHAKQVIPEIRKYSNNVILVGSSGWSSNPQEHGADLDTYSNIAYTMHFYSDNSHKTDYLGRIGQAMASPKNHAVFASEWGMSSSSGDGGFVPVNTGNIKAWIDEMESKGVSYVNWSLGNPKGSAGTGTESETSAALKQGASLTGNWPDADLTPSGLSIKAHLKSKNQEWTPPDTSLKVKTPLAITSAKKTNFTLNGDSITFGSVYSKKVSWELVEKGASGATLTTKGSGTNVAVTHLVGKKDVMPFTKFALGETVNAVLNPLGQKLSYTISPTAGVLHRVHETNLTWEGKRLVLPYDLIPAGTQVQVMLRDPSGKVVFQTSAKMGGFGRIELSQARPRSNGVQILDILTGDESYVRARLSPKF